MSKSRQLSIVGALAVFVFLFGFGTEAWGTSYTWTGGATPDQSWTNPANWGGSGYPTTGDIATFQSDATVTISSAITISELVITGTQLTPIFVTINSTVSPYSLTTNSLNATYADLSVSSTAATGISTQYLSLNDARILSSARTVTLEVGRGEVGTIYMSNVGTSYVGPSVWTNIDNPNAFGVSETRFDASITFTTAANDIIPLGSFNLYLGGEFTEILGLAGTPGSAGGFIAIKQGSENPAPADVGRLCYEYWPGKTMTFTIGPDVPGKKCTPISFNVTTVTGIPDPTQTPFPYVSVRVVHGKHPANNQTPNYQSYWVAQGVGTPDDNGGSVCLNNVEFWYLQAYMSAGGNYSVYPARYADNWEDLDLPNEIGSWNPTGTPVNPGNTTLLSLSGCVPGFGDFSIGAGTTPMPVELTSFSARVVDNQVRLNWETATELNNYGFYIERSADRENWKEIGFVPGNGTSYSPKSYVYFDELGDELQRLPELSYRLRQMDRDGTTDYSNIVNVNTGGLPEGVELYAAYPNPFNPATTISFAIGTPARVTLKVYNALGQAVATILSGSAMDAGLHTVGFDGAQLPSGVYLAVLEANGAVQHQKLVLNK
jgi:hypothetical protein